MLREDARLLTLGLPEPDLMESANLDSFRSVVLSNVVESTDLDSFRSAIHSGHHPEVHYVRTSSKYCPRLNEAERGFCAHASATVW